MPRFSFISHIDAPTHEAALLAHGSINSTSEEGVTIDIGDISQDFERDEKIRELADDQWAKDGEIEIDDGCVVSEGSDNGAYVQAWVWVGFSGTDLDNDEEEEEDSETEQTV